MDFNIKGKYYRSTLRKIMELTFNFFVSFFVWLCYEHTLWIFMSILKLIIAWFIHLTYFNVLIITIYNNNNKITIYGKKKLLSKIIQVLIIGSLFAMSHAQILLWIPFLVFSLKCENKIFWLVNKR